MVFNVFCADQSDVPQASVVFPFFPRIANMKVKIGFYFTSNNIMDAQNGRSLRCLRGYASANLERWGGRRCERGDRVLNKQKLKRKLRLGLGYGYVEHT